MSGGHHPKLHPLLLASGMTKTAATRQVIISKFEVWQAGYIQQQARYKPGRWLNSYLPLTWEGTFHEGLVPKGGRVGKFKTLQTTPINHIKAVAIEFGSTITRNNGTANPSKSSQSEKQRITSALVPFLFCNRELCKNAMYILTSNSSSTSAEFPCSITYHKCIVTVASGGTSGLFCVIHGRNQRAS